MRDWYKDSDLGGGDTTHLNVHTEKWTTETDGEGAEDMPMLFLPNGIDAWPQYLRKIERLRLRVNLHGYYQLYGEGHAFGSIATLLFSLGSFFENPWR